MKKTTALFSFYLLFLSIGFSQVDTRLTKEDSLAYSQKMQWFKDARLGIFIHWGIYAVNGIAESWSFHNRQIGYEDYMAQLKGFTAKAYDPAGWVGLIRESGAAYAVITSKHHDGVCLWESPHCALSVAKQSPAAKDVLSPFVAELRKAGIKTGIYFSLIDWSHPDYPQFLRDQPRYTKDSLRWGRFLGDCHSQIAELSEKFNPDLFWFDGDWEHNAREWDSKGIRERILKHNPGAIINSRLNGFGDYETPEQGAPITRPVAKYWELCLTSNDSWGYQHNDLNFKTPTEVIRIFSDVVSKGGNLLLDIGPRADGSIPEPQAHILKELGRWVKKHELAIRGTRSGIPREHFSGPSTLSADQSMLFLFVEGNPKGRIMLSGIRNEIRSAWVVGNGTYLNHKSYSKAWWSSYPGIYFIEVPDQVLDEETTVIAIRLDGPIKLYREDGSRFSSF